MGKRTTHNEEESVFVLNIKFVCIGMGEKSVQELDFFLLFQDDPEGGT